MPDATASPASDSPADTKSPSHTSYHAVKAWASRRRTRDSRLERAPDDVLTWASRADYDELEEELIRNLRRMSTKFRAAFVALSAVHVEIVPAYRRVEDLITSDAAAYLGFGPCGGGRCRFEVQS